MNLEKLNTGDVCVILMLIWLYPSPIVRLEPDSHFGWLFMLVINLPGVRFVHNCIV